MSDKYDSIPVNDSMEDKQLRHCPDPRCGNQHLWPNIIDATLLCPRCGVVYVVKDGLVQANLEWNIVKVDESNEVSPSSN